MAAKAPKVLNNPKARHDYHIEETFEAGIALQGTEVKSLRAGRGSIREAFVRVDRNHEVYLHNAHIEEYEQGNRENHEPRRTRKLLLNKAEIRKLFNLTHIKGYSVIPLSLYWKKGRVKLEIGAGKGKAKTDKRQDLKKKESDREMKRAAMARFKGR